jgi:hypothetical protein
MGGRSGAGREMAKRTKAHLKKRTKPNLAQRTEAGIGFVLSNWVCSAELGLLPAKRTQCDKTNPIVTVAFLPDRC